MKTKTKVSLIIAGYLATVLLVLLLVVAVLRSRAPDQPLQLWAASFSPDGKTLVTAGAPSPPSQPPARGELIFWNVATGKKRIARDNWGIRSVACSADGKFIAVGQANGTTKLVEPSSGKTLLTLTPHSSLVNAVAVSADSRLVASGGFDGSVILWDVVSRHEETLVLPNEKVLSVAISPARSELVAATRSSGKAYLFNLAQRGAPLVLEACRPAGGNVEGVVFAPDGAKFATVCRRTLRLWESDSGKLVRELQASKGDLLGVAFAPDGATLATVDSEGMLALWNAETGERLQHAQAHFGSAFGLAFSPDGNRLASTGLSDYTLRFWNARTLAPIATFRRAVWKLEGQ